MNPGTLEAGAARERTSLAWRRTALAFAINALLLLRSSDAFTQIGALVVLTLASGLAAWSALTFRNAATSGWLATRRRRGELLVGIAGAVSVLDLIAMTR